MFFIEFIYVTQSPKTVDDYRERIMAKMNVKNTRGMIIFAATNGLLKKEGQTKGNDEDASQNNP